MINSKTHDSKICITVKEEPNTLYPPDNTLRTVVFYQKESSESKPRGYYLRIFSLEMGAPWGTTLTSLRSVAGFDTCSLLFTAKKFARKKLEGTAALFVKNFKLHPHSL